MPDSTNDNSPPIALRLILIASLLLLLLASGAEYLRTPPAPGIESPPTDKSTIDNLIIPGTRLGPVTLGLSTKLLNEVLGVGQLRPQENGLVHLYEDYALVVYTENDRVVSATTRSPFFRTKTGVGVGSDVDLVIKNLGKDFEMTKKSPSQAVLHDWSRGWHVGIEKEKVVYFQITAALIDE